MNPFLVKIFFTAFVLMLIPSIIAMVDIIKSQQTTSHKILWSFVVVIFHLPGVFLYLFFGRKSRSIY